MRRIGRALATIFLMAMVGTAPALAEGDPAPAGAPGQVLSADEYYTMEPFVLPIVEGRSLAPRQYTIVLALRLADIDARGEITRRAARIRDTLYPRLYRLVSFRTRKPRLPGKEALRRALEPLVLDVAGRDYATALVVHEAFLNERPH